MTRAVLCQNIGGGLAPPLHHPFPSFHFLSHLPFPFPFPPLLFLFPRPPLRSRPLKYSYRVWESIVSFPSRVWNEATAEIEFCAF